jgi:protein-S-isoprenylcysteine O-methyltransferase Ste14
VEAWIGRLFSFLWLAWVAYWWISARGVKQAVRRESRISRIGHFLPLGVAAWLLAAPSLPHGWLTRPILPPSAALAITGVAVTALGLALTAWARQLLGANWSGDVTVKQDHELIRRGPYRFVRHPIYSGLLLAFCGSALARDDWRGLAALLIVWLALWRKWRLEERFMRETFGPAYSEYAAGTPAVIPRLF